MGAFAHATAIKHGRDIDTANERSAGGVKWKAPKLPGEHIDHLIDHNKRHDLKVVVRDTFSGALAKHRKMQAEANRPVAPMPVVERVLPIKPDLPIVPAYQFGQPEPRFMLIVGRIPIY